MFPSRELHSPLPRGQPSEVSNDHGGFSRTRDAQGEKKLDPSSIWKEESDCKDYSYSFGRQGVEKKISRIRGRIEYQNEQEGTEVNREPHIFFVFPLFPPVLISLTTNHSL
jgi:hypothetical protein